MKKGNKQYDYMSSGQMILNGGTDEEMVVIFQEQKRAVEENFSFVSKHQ